MRPVKREEILDYITYTEKRSELQSSVLKQKEPRRIHLGEYLTFLFENTDTVRYQIQEMMKAEQIVKEEAIQHEIDTYNELLGSKGELGCVLLIEIADANERPQKLKDWLGLQTSPWIQARGFMPSGTSDRSMRKNFLRFNISNLIPPEMLPRQLVSIILDYRMKQNCLTNNGKRLPKT